MTMNQVERLVRQRLVDAFVKADYADIQLVRRPRVRTPAGSWTDGPPQTLPPQRVRLIVSKRRYNSAMVNTEAGDIEKYPYNLIGDSNMDIKERDTFTYGGNVYKVVSLEADREERTLASLEYFGKAEGLHD